MGVQDNQEVQLAINRVQSTNHMASLIKAAGQSGIDSINLDLVYGLPMQNELSFASKISKFEFRSRAYLIIQLRPYVIEISCSAQNQR